MPRLLPVCLVLPLLAGCGLPDFMTFPPQVRGNRVTGDQLQQIVPGTSSRADVFAALGSPSTKAVFDDNTWIYIGEVTKPVIGATQEVLEQDVVAINFDAKGVVQTITTKTAADSVPVTMVSRATPAPGTNPSLLQQLFGNVGRFGTGGGGGGGPGSRSGGI